MKTVNSARKVTSSSLMKIIFILTVVCILGKLSECKTNPKRFLQATIQFDPLCFKFDP